MARPTDASSTWAESSANVADPGLSKKNAGWLASEVVPSSWLNFLFRNWGRWIRYFEDVFSGADGDWGLVWGQGGADAIALRSDVEGGATTFKHIFSFAAGAPRRVHLYVSDDAAVSSMVLCVNAHWDTSTLLWVLDDSAEAAYAILFTPGFGISLATKPAASGPWSHASWDTGSLVASSIFCDDVDVSGVATFDAAAGAMIYGSPLSVTKGVDLRTGARTTSFTYTAAAAPNEDTLTATAGGSVLDVPLSVPPGAVLTQVRAVVDTAPGAGDVVMQVFHVVPNFTTGAQPKTQLGSSTQDSSSGVQVLTVATNTAIPSPNTVFVRFTCANNAILRTGMSFTFTTTNARHF